MPPKSFLCTWKKEIQQFQKIRGDELGYVDCNLKKGARYDIQAINQLLKVYKALESSKEVKRELDWYAEWLTGQLMWKLVPNNKESSSSKICCIHPDVTNFFVITICRLKNCPKYAAPGGCLAITCAG